MAQPKPERVSVEELLKLVDQLTPEEQEQMIEEMRLQWLRREMARAEESLARADIIDGEEVFNLLRQRNASLKEKSNP